MYQALYRKWRPRTFEEVVGQEHITTTLKNEIMQGRPSHAYLLMGSRGTGKTTCAKLIAKAVNCRAPRNGSPCGECDCCRGVDNGSLVDVVEIDAASNNGVDNIRDLRDEAVFLPNVAKYRVYIIDEAHMLSQGAVNALLKIMEEPPEHVIFILATTEVHKIPATIQSRCQRFDFKRIAPEVIRERLLYIAGQEGISLTEDAAALIARIADGGMRDALSLLDLCWAHSCEVTAKTVSEAAGLVGQDHLFMIAKAAAEGDFTGALKLVEELGSRSVEYDRLCGQLVTHYRNLLVAATAKDPAELIVCLPDILEKYKAQASGISTAQMMDAIRILQDTQSAMTRTSSRRAEMELGLLKLCDRRAGRSPEAMMARIDELEAKLNRLLAEGVPPAAAPREEQPEQSAAKEEEEQVTLFRKEEISPLRAPACAPAREEAPPEAASAAAVTPVAEEQWQQILDRLTVTNKMLSAALRDSRAYTRGQTMLVECKNPVFIEMMRSNEFTRTSLKRAIAEVTGVKYGVGPYTAEDPAKKADEPSPLESLLQSAAEQGVPIIRE